MQYPQIDKNQSSKDQIVINTLYWEVIIFDLRNKAIRTNNSRINKVRRFTKDELSQIV